MVHVIKFFLLFLLSTNAIFPAKLTFLPVIIGGKIPEKLQNIPDLPMELSLLQSYYARDIYYVETSSKSEISNTVEISVVKKKPDLSDYQKYCNRTESDYIIFSELSFVADRNKNILFSEVMNCANKSREVKESFISGNIRIGMKNFIRRQFYYLPRKRTSSSLTRKGIANNKASANIIYLVDYSISFQREITNFKNVLKRITGVGGRKTGIFILKKNSYKYFPPAKDVAKAIQYIESTRPSGEITLHDISDGINRLKVLLKEEDANAEIVILTDAKFSNGDSVRFPVTMRSLKNNVGEVKMITGSLYDNNSFNLLKKSARAGGEELVQITYSQKIGTKDGYKYVYLQNMNIYYSNAADIPSNKNIKNLNKIPPGEIYSRTASLRPEMMVNLFSAIMKEKILEQEKVESDLETILEKDYYSDLASKDEFSRQSGRVLFSSGGSAVWLNMNLNSSMIGKELVIQSRLVSDLRTSYGFKNIINETRIVENEFPLLLLMTPQEINKELKNKSTVECLIKGKVLDVR